MSLVLAGSTSGSVTLQEPAIAGTTVLTLPAVSGTVLTTASTFGGTGPAFKSHQNADQNISANIGTKVNLQTEVFDTNSNFASSRFTPTVAGYYQINAAVGTKTPMNSSQFFIAIISKNGSGYAQQTIYPSPANFTMAVVSDVVFLNGTTDYVELVSQASVDFVTWAGIGTTFLSGCLVRSA
jgi:hypothetical protein